MAQKNTKPKEMFKPYNADTVPDTMPFPELTRVAATKSEEAAVPVLNDYQRSWILDVGVRGMDLLGLSGHEAKAFYECVKADAFEAKAFQHKVQPQDRAEEARLPALVTAWKLKQKKESSAGVDEGDANDQEEDDGGRVTLLRGYSRAGWRMVCARYIASDAL